jgi:hypothetical protein
MKVAIGERFKFELRKMGYPLCPCANSQPHAIDALRKSVEQLKDARMEEKAGMEEKARLIIIAFTTLRTLDMMKEVKHSREQLGNYTNYVRRQIRGSHIMTSRTTENLLTMF